MIFIVKARTLHFLNFFLFTSLISAHAGSIEGTVKGSDRKAIKGVKIRIERRDAKGPVIAAKSDTKGRYAVNNLATGAYELTLLVDKTPIAVGRMWTRLEGGVRVDFEINAKGRAQIRRYVWLAAETGSHFGGRWVEIDGRGKPEPGVNPVDRASGAELQKAIPGNASGR
ncbi:MAG: hypothetical protein JWO45_1459 [Spartobacteria bacterium]|nr:hypothetical protein [Spartobacteria bacterium]